MSAPASTPRELRRRIADRTATVCIVGLGYVGLPLAVEFAAAGFPVLGLEVDAARVESLEAWRSYIADVADERLAKAR